MKYLHVAEDGSMSVLPNYTYRAALVYANERIEFKIGGYRRRIAEMQRRYHPHNRREYGQTLDDEMAEIARLLGAERDVPPLYIVISSFIETKDS